MYLQRNKETKMQYPHNECNLKIQPIAVQACLPLRMLALHSKRSNDYAFYSSTAPTKRNPAPVSAILMRTVGWT
jgi:hypothetical protein